MKNTATLLITCPDARGIVAAIADFLLQHNANIYTQTSIRMQKIIFSDACGVGLG